MVTRTQNLTELQAEVAGFTTVARVQDIPPGSGRVVNLAGASLALFNVNGEFFAIDNACLHKGGPLGEGKLDGCVVTCPWHGWQFDVTTGKSQFNPNFGVKVYRVKVEDEDIKIAP